MCSSLSTSQLTKPPFKVTSAEVSINCLAIMLQSYLGFGDVLDPVKAELASPEVWKLVQIVGPSSFAAKTHGPQGWLVEKA